MPIKHHLKTLTRRYRYLGLVKLDPEFFRRKHLSVIDPKAELVTYLCVSTQQDGESILPASCGDLHHGRLPETSKTPCVYCKQGYRVVAFKHTRGVVRTLASAKAQLNDAFASEYHIDTQSMRRTSALDRYKMINNPSEPDLQSRRLPFSGDSI